jgi:copper transport protein
VRDNHTVQFKWLDDVRQSRRLAITAVLGLSIGVAAVGSTAVSAHANLVRSEPEANAVLDSPPTQVRLWFSEVPEAGFSKLQLFDKTGVELADVGAVHGDATDDKLLTASLPALSKGIYTIVWRTTSQIDGHVTSGGFAFVYGRNQVPAGGLKLTVPGTLSIASGPTLPSVATRWVGYLAMALLMGGFAFAPLVWRPAIRSVYPLYTATPPTRGAVERMAIESPFLSMGDSLYRLLVITWIVLLTTTIASAFVEAATASGGDPLANGALARLLDTTRYGAIFRLRIALMAVLGLTFAVRRWRWRGAIRWWIAGSVLSGLLFLTTSLNSHAAATPQPILPIAADWVHLMLGAIWMGGLVALLLTLLWLRRAGDSLSVKVLAILVSRFSRVATICVAGLAFTGLIQGFFEVADLANLVDTQYGLTLLVKSALLLPLLCAAGINLLLVKRRMRAALEWPDLPDQAAAMRPWQRLIVKTVAVEIVFVAAIFLVTGILTTLPPAHEAFGSGSLMRGEAGDLRLIVAVNPGLPGLNTFDVYVKDQLDRPVSAVEKVVLIFSMREHDMGQSEAVAVPADNGQNGHFVAQGGYVSMIGTWVVEVLVRRSNQDDVRASLTMPIVSVNQLPTSPVLVAPSRALFGMEIMFGSLLIYLAGRRLKQVRRWTIWVGAAAASAVFVLGLTVTANAFAVGMYAIPAAENPIPADAASLARGQQVYVAQCLACHGETGAGDGSVGTFMKPPPSNFQAIPLPYPSDGQLFDWITRGMEASSMPGFGENLTDQQRWDVINYIRTFAKRS